MHDYLTLLQSLDRVLDRPAALHATLKAAALAAPDSPRTPSMLNALCENTTIGTDDLVFLLEFPNAEVRKHAAQQQDLSVEMWERYLRYETDERTLVSLRGVAPVHQLSRAALNLLFGMPEDADQVTPAGAEAVLACLFSAENPVSPLWVEALLVRGLPDDLGSMEVDWYGAPLIDGTIVVDDADVERMHPMYQLAHACSPQARDGSLAAVLGPRPELITDNPHVNVALSWIRRVARVPVNRAKDLAFIQACEFGDVRVSVEDVPVGLPDDEMMLWAIDSSSLFGAMELAPRPENLADCWIRLDPSLRSDALATALLKAVDSSDEYTAKVVAVLGDQFPAAVDPLLDDIDPTRSTVAQVPSWLSRADPQLWVRSVSRLMGDDRIRGALNTASPELLDLAVQDLMAHPAAWLARPVLFLADKVGFGPDQWARLTADQMTTVLLAGDDEHSSGKRLARWLLEQVTNDHLTSQLGALTAIELTQRDTSVGDVITAAAVIG